MAVLTPRKEKGRHKLHSAKCGGRWEVIQYVVNGPESHFEKESLHVFTVQHFVAILESLEEEWRH